MKIAIRVLAIRVLMIMLAFGLTASFAHADTIVYGFVGQGLNGPASFTLTVSAPLAGTGATGRQPDLSFMPGPNLVCNGCALIDFFKDAPAHGFVSPNEPSDAFGFQIMSGLTTTETFFYFDPNAVLTDGTHNSILPRVNTGTLTVSGVNAQVPEAPLLFLLVAGLTVLGALTYSQRRETNLGGEHIGSKEWRQHREHGWRSYAEKCIDFYSNAIFGNGPANQ